MTKINKYTNFFCSIIVIVVLPFVPIGLQYVFKSQVSQESLALSVAMYSVSMVVNSGYFLLLLLSLLAIMGFSVAYGVIITSTNPTLVNCTGWALFTIIVIALSHIVERYNRHIKREESFIQTYK